MYRRDHITLFIGDLAVFLGGLWLALWLRHFEVPQAYDFGVHLVSFAPLFILWFIVFETVGLYDRQVALFERKLSATILEAQGVNFILALSYFFIVPLEVQPKIVLVLYFVISTLLIVVWRLGLFQYQFRVGGNDQVVVVGSGSDIEKIVNEISSNQNTMLDCVAFVRELRDAPKNYLLIVDPRLGVPPSALDATEVYESLFSRVPLTLVNREAFILATTSRTRRLYDILKRCMDIVLAIILGVVTVWVYPILYVAITAYDRGVFFYTTDRIGKGGARISFSKFRTMTGTDSGTAVLKSKLSVTPLGKFLRISRVDELPQLWSIIRGDLSLIGPRPELPALVDEYRSLIPLYDLRHAVTPGLSGWAQIYHQEHPHHGSNVAETAVKLSYDLYYIKHRSFMLDLDIALKTAKALALRLGA